MKQTVLSAFVAFAGFAFGQNQILPPQTAPDLNLPAQRIGQDDLISVSVYDRPELTRTVRVAADGTIQLPLLAGPIRATGLMPADLAMSIVAQLIREEILVRPVVSVSVAEYRSRPVSVIGAVHHPLTFQASGTVQLLDAIARAEGLTPEAGNEILVTQRSERGSDVVQRISVKQLVNSADPKLNILLRGGEEIRVPEAGKVYVVGNVKKPGVVTLNDGEDMTVLKVLALSQGLQPFATKDAFVYRRQAGAEGKTELTIPLDRIVQRKSPDFVLQENDIFYIPDNKTRRLAITALDRIAGFGGTAGAAVIYAGAH